ncbi:hypothetical protein [Sphingomonas sp. T9W2]|uniref:hypothetical protein n=1 Tax=Sphingomonas sp. T9W2 TaxID=3143183 RepID=UPI0031F4A9EF
MDARRDPPVVTPTLAGAAEQWRTPAVADPGITLDRLHTVDGSDWTPGQRAYDAETGRMAQTGLTQQAEQWSTPRASDGEKGGPNMAFGAGGTPLPSQAARWPSPMARDHKGGGDATVRSDGKTRMDMLDWRAEAWQPLDACDPSRPDQPTPSGSTSSETRRRLNPLFVEWLMGWPEGLSGFDTAAMGSCHSPQPSHGCGCMDCWLTKQRAMLSDLLTIDPPAQGLLL